LGIPPRCAGTAIVTTSGLVAVPADAKLLIALDRAAGGSSQVLKIEFKHCDMCAGSLIGKLIESGPTARTTPCGPELRTGSRDAAMEEAGTELEDAARLKSLLS
jgi:hypothetical protein